MVKFKQQQQGDSSRCGVVKQLFSDDLMELWERTEETDREHGMMFYNMGGVWENGPIQTGEDRSITPTRARTQIEDGASHITWVHTHPVNTEFGMSAGDISSLITNMADLYRKESGKIIDCHLVLEYSHAKESLFLHGFEWTGDYSGLPPLTEKLRDMQETVELEYLEGNPSMASAVRESMMEEIQDRIKMCAVEV